MASYDRISQAELSGRLRNRLDGVGVFWVGDERRDALNESLAFWQAITMDWEYTITVPVMSGHGHYYAVPKQIVHPRRVRHNGVPLTLAGLYELDFGSPGWEGVSGTPLYWCPIGINEVAIVPAPVSGVLEFLGVNETRLLNVGGDDLSLGDEEVTRLLNYSQHYSAIKEGTTEMEATIGLVGGVVAAAGLKNRRLLQSNLYRNYMGQVRDEWMRAPVAPEGER